jgi:hypothetical protein
VLRIGTLVQEKFNNRSLFSIKQLLRQSDIWFNKVISIRETIPRNIPPSEKYVETKGNKDGTYTLWGWDRECDLAYVRAMWRKGISQEVTLPFCVSCLILDTGEVEGS